MATFVLVHGAFHGGWCWRDFTPYLKALGHKVLTPTLPGLGDRIGEATKDVGLSTHVADILALYEREDLTNTILVGHSYGGPVVGGVADAIHEKVSTLIYLDAVIPVSGKSVLDFQFEERRQSLLAQAAGHNGWQIPPPPISFYGIFDTDQQAWANAECVPQPLKCFSEPSSVTGAWNTIAQKSYIRCTNPALEYMNQFQNFAEQQADWDIYEIATGHDCMITAPAELAEVLLKYVA